VTEPRDPAKADLERLILGATGESFRLIVDTIPGLIAVMTPEGGVEHVNRQVVEYFGRTLEELKQWRTTDAVTVRACMARRRITRARKCVPRTCKPSSAVL
jgi:PAS domain-containing protein